MTCPDNELHEDYPEIRVSTYVPFNSNSMDFISYYPSVFMRGADYVIVDFPASCIIASWKPNTYKSPSSGKLIHCPGGFLTIKFRCDGSQPVIHLDGILSGAIAGFKHGHKRVMKSSWVIPVGYPVAVRQSDSLSLDNDECLPGDFISVFHFCDYFQKLTGYVDSQGAPAHITVIPGPDNSIMNQFLILEIGNTEPSAPFLCGACIGSIETTISPTEDTFIDAIDYFISKETTKTTALAEALAIDLIAIGEILSGEIPGRVCIPLGCGCYASFRILEEEEVIQAETLFIPTNRCNDIYYRVDYKGPICFSVDWPAPEPPGPSTGGPQLPPGASPVQPPVPPPPGAGPSPIGWGWSFPDASPPPVYRYPRHVKAQGFQQAVVGCGYTPNPLHFTSNCFYMYNDDDLKLVVKPYDCGGGQTIYDNRFFLRQYKVDAAGWAVKTDNWKFCGGDWFHHTQYTKEPTQFPAILPCQGTCYKWRVEVILTSNGNPPYPGGMTIRNYIDVVCSIAPHIEKEDGVAYLYSGANVLGPLGWAASMYLWFDVSLGTRTCLT